MTVRIDASPCAVCGGGRLIHMDAHAGGRSEARVVCPRCGTEESYFADSLGLFEIRVQAVSTDTKAEE